MANGTGLPTIQPDATLQMVDQSAGGGQQALVNMIGQAGSAVAAAAQTVVHVEQAHEAAVDAAHLATQKSRIDDEVSQLHAANLYDPDAFQKGLLGLRKGVVTSTSSRHAAELGAYIDHTGGSALGSIRIESARRQHQLAGEAIESRQQRLTTDLSDAIAGSGQGLAAFSDPANANKLAEWRSTYDQQVAGGFMSREEADARLADGLGNLKAGAITAHAEATYRAGGLDAALAEVQAIRQDPSLAPHERELAAAKATARVREVANLDQERVNNQKALTRDAEDKLQDLIDEDVGATSLTGKGTGLTEEQVRERFGSDGVAKWYHQKGEALKDYQLYGDLSRLPPDQAAARIAAAHRQSVSSLPAAIGNDNQLDALLDAQHLVESSGGKNPAAYVAHDGGVMGPYQIKLDTARRFDPNATNEKLRNSDYSRGIAKQYMRFLLTRYNGDTMLATTGYVAGEGNVDKWIRQHGDPRVTGDREGWLNKVRDAGNPQSAEYAGKVANAMGGGRAMAAWDRANRQRQEDPAGAVSGDYAVQAMENRLAAEARANGGVPRPGTQLARVDTYLKAQDRAGIPRREQQPLPNNVLTTMASSLQAIMARGDDAGFQAYTDRVLRDFSDPANPRSKGYGPRVLQALLTKAGASDFAARHAANVTHVAQSGGKITTAHRDEAQVAANVQAGHAAMNGTAKAPHQMTDAEIMQNLKAMGG